MTYDEQLNAQFKDLKINLVKHDTSLTGLPCYIEVHLGKTPKDKGLLALDLGNYIYRRFGLSYQHVPEFRGRGKKTTLRWFMSWKDLAPIQENICRAFDKPVLMDYHLPIEFYSLIIQNTARGVYPQQRGE